MADVADVEDVEIGFCDVGVTFEFELAILVMFTFLGKFNFINPMF